ncbi:LCP family protein [Corynebacterium spheniscorum]|uniref:Transcriptional attenuator, LytR family n=2 Tax=Corynebacterium spheniscorum TaxID=185761 RepID=A0A1I2UU36_9CORY|nr:LCP family protein [Corynebacterium spheniscorum]SFG79267.1 transcriptional attenuator, LytR family [Corynebacterium spheniscorum]
MRGDEGQGGRYRDSYGDDIARDRHGRPILDRYGRPVRRRPSTARPGTRRPRTADPDGNPLPPISKSARPRAEERPRVQPPRERPRQVFPEQPAAAAPPLYTQQYPAAPAQGYQPRYQAPAAPPPQAAPPVSPQVAPPPPPAPRRRRRARRGGCFRPVRNVLILLLVVVLGTGIWADSKLTRVDAFPDTPIASTSGSNWLLVGSDSRQGLTEEDIARLGTGGDIGTGRTDTIMLLHIPTVGKAKLVSIPRDSYVAIPGYGMDKINASFAYGGPKLLAATVEQATGIHIDHYAEIGMGGLAHVVDAVGGVELCPDQPIDDPLANLNVQAGCQKMDGPTALGYVRTRATAQGDLDRVQRQREFFSAIVATATQPSTLLNPFRFFPLINGAVGSFTVGEGDHVWHLARLALAMKSGVETETVPVGGFANYDVGSVVLWDEVQAPALWDSMR